MRTRAVALAASTVVMFALGLVATSAASAQSATPTATVDSTSLGLGQRVLVQGDGWAPGTQAHIELCGNAATNLSADCDLVHGVDAGVGSDGHFSQLLTIADPGQPCPCVVRVTDSEAAGEALVAVQVVGLATATPTATPLPDLSASIEITNAHVTGHGNWAAWFGAGSKRTFVFGVRNIGALPLHNPPLSIVFGRGNDPHGFVTAPNIGELAPGQIAIFQVPVSVDSLTWGDFTVRGEIGGNNKPVIFLARTSNRPWGLVVLALILLQLLLLAIRNIVRRRLYREVAEEKIESIDEHALFVPSMVDDGDADEEPVDDVIVLADEPDDDDVAAPEMQPVVALAESVHAASDALIKAVGVRAVAMRVAADMIEQEAEDATAATVRDAAAYRLVIEERHRLARVDLERSRAEALDLLELARLRSTAMLDDAERRARTLVEHARHDASALLLAATPEAFDGPTSVRSDEIVLPDDLIAAREAESAERQRPPF